MRAKAGKASRPTPSCTECHRRKQKCNRQWPCNHCHSRKIPHRCKFTPKRNAKSPPSLDQAVTPPLLQGTGTKSDENEDASSELRALGTKDELRVLGYLSDNHSLLKKPQAKILSSSCSFDTLPPQMRDVMRLLPARPYIDILVQRYLETTNFTYYSLYPPSFSNDYASWWTDRSNGCSLAPEFTCLLARVCACSAQYLDSESQQRLESDLGESVQNISENLHNSAKQLSNTIAPGRGGLVQVQQLFLTSAWYKSESLFVESWHSLSSCIHEAQEQGLHKASQRGSLSEFDLEMRRRMWCLLYTWDWQMSLFLSRPRIISQNCHSIELPNMKLEVQDIEGPPSPVYHIIAQLQLGMTVTNLDPAPNGVVDPSKADLMRQCVNEWLNSLAPAYREVDPDTRWDDEHIYIPLQRRQMHAIGYMTMFGSFKPFLTKVYDSTSIEAERARREVAIDIGLHLMEVCRRLFEQVFPINAKFHLVTFLIFDTAAFLCSATIHDNDNSLPRREEVVHSIKLACSLMKKLSPITKTAAVCYPVIAKLANSITNPSRKTAILNGSGEQLMGSSSMTDHSPGLSMQTILPDSIELALESTSQADLFLPTSLDFAFQNIDTPPMTGISDLSNIDIGQFDQIWDWQDLDLTFPPDFPFTRN